MNPPEDGLKFRLKSAFGNRPNKTAFKNMLRNFQIKFLKTVPKGQIVEIRPFDPKSQTVAKGVIAEIKKKIPQVEILFTGSAALGIAGRNEIDLWVFSKDPALIAKLKHPDRPQQKPFLHWEFERRGFKVDLNFIKDYFAGFDEVLKIFELLKDNPHLAKEYEAIKLAANGASAREYMKKKYEFFNRILGFA